MSRITESISHFYQGAYAYPRGYGTAALSLAVTCGITEAASGVNEITEATAGYAGGFILLTAISGIAAVIGQHRGENSQHS